MKADLRKCSSIYPSSESLSLYLYVRQGPGISPQACFSAYDIPPRA